MAPILYFVIPCYNEAQVLPLSAPVLLEKLEALEKQGRIASQSRILFVNDGSADGTWELISMLHRGDERFSGISLSHNAGEQNAYLAGMATAVNLADVIITMDCDLQDDIQAVDRMLDRFEEGCDIVYGVRSKREKDSFGQRFTSGAFYKLMKALGTGLVEEHSQYRLMSRRAVEALGEYGEVNLFLPALVSRLGFQTAIVEHERFARAAGKSAYNFKRLLKLSIEAITSFSAAPLGLITLFAMLSALFCIISLVTCIVDSVLTGGFRTDWALITALWLVSFFITGSVRIVGEYICKNYIETKHRPRYHIGEMLLDKQD